VVVVPSPVSERETGELLHIAEDFLSDPLMRHLSNSPPEYLASYSSTAGSPGLAPAEPASELRLSELRANSRQERRGTGFFGGGNATGVINLHNVAADLDTPSPTLSLADDDIMS
jgi:hypothetical protein